MQIGGRHFKPSLFGTLATLFMLSVLISLGLWQLRRADEKAALLDRLQSGMSTTQQLGAANIDTLPLLQQVSVSGHYDDARQILLDNMWSSRHADVNGRAAGAQPGFNVLTPLVLDDGHTVLVNRGWVPLGPSRQNLPAISVAGNSRSIRGRISNLPQPGIRLSNNAAAAGWPRLLNYPTLAELRALFGERILPRIVLLDAAEADGYERDWSDRFDFGDFGPSRHVGYAVQWFGMALALLAIYIVVSLKRPQRGPP